MPAANKAKAKESGKLPIVLRDLSIQTEMEEALVPEIQQIIQTVDLSSFESRLSKTEEVTPQITERLNKLRTQDANHSTEATHLITSVHTANNYLGQQFTEIPKEVLPNVEKSFAENAKKEAAVIEEINSGLMAKMNEMIKFSDETILNAISEKIAPLSYVLEREGEEDEEGEGEIDLFLDDETDQEDQAAGDAAGERPTASTDVGSASMGSRTAEEIPAPVQSIPTPPAQTAPTSPPRNFQSSPTP